MLGRAALQSSFVGFNAFVIFKVVGSLAPFALLLWPLRLLRSISQNRLVMRHRMDPLLGVGVAFLWATVVLGQLDLLGPARAGVGRGLAAAITLGALSVSVGDVMAFALTVWLSYLLAHLVDFVLREDVSRACKPAAACPTPSRAWCGTR